MIQSELCGEVSTQRTKDKKPQDNIMQNIPSKEKAIRMLFKASPGHVMVGSDFSLQKVG